MNRFVFISVAIRSFAKNFDEHKDTKAIMITMRTNRMDRMKIHSIIKYVYYSPMPLFKNPAWAPTMSTISKPIIACRHNKKKKTNKSCYIYLNEFYCWLSNFKMKMCKYRFYFHCVTWKWNFCVLCTVIHRKTSHSLTPTHFRMAKIRMMLPSIR